MSPDTNNNVGGTEEHDDEEEEDEDEPVFKFSTITVGPGVRKNNENSKNIPAEFSCIAVHEKFLVIGKPTGEIIITDHLGNIISQFQIKAHTYPVNAISIDDNGEFIGSCCQEGKVKISGLLNKTDDQLITFNRPIRAVCLDPNFARTKMFVTGDTSLVLNERGTFYRHKTTPLFEFNGGLIHTLRWKETLIAFANDKGVGIYDLRARRLIGLEETDGQKELPRGVYPSRISWNDPTTLAVACAKTIKILSITTEASSEHQANAPKKHINTTMSFKIEFYACGLTSVNRDLVVFGIEDFSIAAGTSDPSLTVLVSKGKIYEEKAHDPFRMYNDELTSPFQFQIEYLPDEQCFFILSPYDIVKAERRDYDDHIEYLINKKRFEDAIKAFENPPSPNEKPKRYNPQTIYLAYVKSLMEANQKEKAVELFPRVYTTSKEWEEQILTFIQRNELDLIVSKIPTSKPQLDAAIYEKVLSTYLMQKKFEKLKELLLQWPSNIFNLTSIDQLIRLQMDDERTAKALLECSAVIAEKQGNVSKTLDIYLKMDNAQVFQLIERKNLHAEILPHIEKLMSINRKTALDMLINHMDKLPVRSVYNVLQNSPRNLHAYLDGVFSKNPNDSRDFHTAQVSLYANYEPEKLLGFLRKAGNYNLQEALAICEVKNLYRETVFLYGRAGNGPVALQIILEQLHDIEEAIKFCRETGSEQLWTRLIEQSVGKPEFIRGLLNHAGSDINLQKLIDSIGADLRIPGLRDSLCKIMQDFNIQMVLLGFIDEPKGGKTGYDDDPSNWTISRIGGQPAYPSEEVSIKLKSCLLCAKCQAEQIFVCQVYCPLEGHKYDRTLYLFACRNPSCWNTSASWTAIRCQKFDETVEESNQIDDAPPATVPVSATDWCDDADAWNSDDNDDGVKIEKKSILVVTKVKKEIKIEPEIPLSTMTIEDENEKSSSDEEDEIDVDAKTKSKDKLVPVASIDAFNEWKKTNLKQQTLDSSNSASFPFYYIVIDDEQDVIDEAKLNEKKTLKKKVRQLNAIDEDEDDDSTKGGKEKYEKTPDIEHGDVVFYRFQQKIRYAPDQIIRYDWSGNPLILTKLNANTLSTTQKCRHCQSSCVFEFQLMPALVNFLKLDNQIGLEFGAVFVYTCSANCWNNNNNDLYRFENVFVQADPDQSLFD
ncbi:unnamed protein product [Rotaria magnacalcarata]|uniref:Uncharacterized protein n=2 Tax=Rotaria magnacalcarata TaxID=392030 RepID=A0A819FY69_9BILA|nr:unnamed protein product [Rotaria magnacalcarata]